MAPLEIEVLSFLKTYVVVSIDSKGFPILVSGCLLVEVELSSALEVFLITKPWLKKKNQLSSEKNMPNFSLLCHVSFVGLISFALNGEKESL